MINVRMPYSPKLPDHPHIGLEGAVSGFIVTLSLAGPGLPFVTSVTDVFFDSGVTPLNWLCRTFGGDGMSCSVTMSHK